MTKFCPLSLLLTRIGLMLVCSLLYTDSVRSQSTTDEPQSLFRRTGIIKTDKISESSGVAVSGYRPNAFWTINDSDQGTEIYCLSEAGELLCELELKSARNQDWEAMSGFRIDNVPHLLIADVGDNSLHRTNYQFYIFPEPEFKTGKKKQKKLKITPQRIEFTFDDGPKNCEAVAVDPLTNELWLVEKIYLDVREKRPPGIYILPLARFLDPLKVDRQPAIAKRIGDYPIRNVTGMDFSPDGNRLIIRNYLNAHLYERVENKNWQESVRLTQPIPIPLPLQLQGEAIGFSADSKSFIVTSEHSNQPIWSIDLEGYLRQLQQEKQR